MRKLFTLGALTLWSAVHVASASAQPPDVQLRTNSGLDRALSNRATLLERAGAEARGQSQTRVEISGRQAAEARVNAEFRINAATRGNGRENRALPFAGAERLNPGLIRRTSETERIAEFRGRVRSEEEVAKRNKAEGQGHGPMGPRSQERREIVQARAEVLANTSPADRLLARRLAQIDKMRDIALENGNERQLEQADKLEQLARWQYEHRFEARANNPFADVTAETKQDATLTRHPFRPNRDLTPAVEIETNTTVETETNTTTETETAATINP